MEGVLAKRQEDSLVDPRDHVAAVRGDARRNKVGVGRALGTVPGANSVCISASGSAAAVLLLLLLLPLLLLYSCCQEVAQPAPIVEPLARGQVLGQARSSRDGLAMSLTEAYRRCVIQVPSGFVGVTASAVAVVVHARDEQGRRAVERMLLHVLAQPTGWVREGARAHLQAGVVLAAAPLCHHSTTQQHGRSRRHCQPPRCTATCPSLPPETKQHGQRARRQRPSSVLGGERGPPSTSGGRCPTTPPRRPGPLYAHARPRRRTRVPRPCLPRTCRSGRRHRIAPAHAHMQSIIIYQLLTCKKLMCNIARRARRTCGGRYLAPRPMCTYRACVRPRLQRERGKAARDGPRARRLFSL
eukprot:scaffold392_cov350-Prasinococcus_capsulatus_cf.AAC.5